MTIGRQIIERCAADRGDDTYSQPKRYADGYSDCSSYLQRIFNAIAGVDVGSYTTAIASDRDGRDITRDPNDLRTGNGLQDGDVVLFGWSSDHRPGYPFSHVETWDAQRKGTWGQYGDIPPHNGPNFHPAGWGLNRVDRILVRRFLPDEIGASGPAPSRPAPDLNPLPGDPRIRLVVDHDLGPKTVSRIEQWSGCPLSGRRTLSTAAWASVQAAINALDPNPPLLEVDGQAGPKTIAALQVLVGASLTGRLDAQTVAAWQTYLNTH